MIVKTNIKSGAASDGVITRYESRQIGRAKRNADIANK